MCSIALHKALNNLAYKAYFYVIIYRSYKLSKLVSFLANSVQWPTLYNDMTM